MEMIQVLVSMKVGFRDLEVVENNPKILNMLFMFVQCTERFIPTQIEMIQFLVSVEVDEIEN